MLTFDHLLRAADLDPARTHLVRHADTRANGGYRSLYALWRDDRPMFELYQSIQRRPVFSPGNKVASFVVTPASETLFVGIYDVEASSQAPPELRDPFTGENVGGLFLYNLRLEAALSEYIGKLEIDWGLGTRSWVQRGGRSPKAIVAIKRALEDERFPGYLSLITSLSEVRAMPPTWRERLLEAKGVYVLTCPATKELYVGSATGDGGFYERWCEHAVKGGDAVHFRSRATQDYQVSILEVAGSGASRTDIQNAEQLWMKKLQSRVIGLN